MPTIILQSILLNNGKEKIKKMMNVGIGIFISRNKVYLVSTISHYFEQNYFKLSVFYYNPQ